MSMAMAQQISSLEKRFEDFQKESSGVREEVLEMHEELRAAIGQMSSLALKRAMERPPIPIPPAPKCLYELGLVS